MLNPDEEFNVSKFSIEASKIIDIIHKQDKTPIVCGGSGLYIKSLIDGIIDKVETDNSYRVINYQQFRKKFGNEYLYDELIKFDNKNASQMLPQNWKRVVRALEVHHLTRKSFRILPFTEKAKIKIQFYSVWTRMGENESLSAD